jgi:hypothetical protein
MAKHADESVLKWVAVWQQRLLRHLTQRCDFGKPQSGLTKSGLPEYSLPECDSSASKLPQSESAGAEVKQRVVELLLVVLCLYLSEQRGIIPPQTLEQIKECTDTYAELTLLWQKLCKQTEQRFAILNLPAEWDLSNKTVQQIIASLYVAEPDKQLDLDILAFAYEQLLAGLNRSSHRQKYRQPPNQTNRSATRSSRLGVYYTPKPIVQYIVHSTIHRAIENTSTPNILDPACGGGVFLLEAYQYLLDQLENKQKQPCWNAHCCLLQLIHGVDIDPFAVKVTRLSLWLKLLESQAPQLLDDSEPPTALPDLNICVGNALTVVTTDKAAATENITPAFDWRSAFPTVFAAGGFDVVIGNPPYIDAESMAVHLPEWRSYCTAHYQSAKGNWDLFCVFIEKALELCRTGGFTSMIVPNKLLSADYARAARAILSGANQLLCLRDYSTVPIFAASVYPVVYLAQKTEPRSTTMTLYEQMQTVEQARCSHLVSLQNSNWSNQAWSVSNDIQARLMQRLEQYPKLGDLTQVTGAATVAEAYAIQPLIRNRQCSEPEDLRLINSGTIDRYRMLWGDKPLRYLGQLYSHPVINSSQLGQLLPRRLLQARQPKIIVAGMTRRLECLLDQSGDILAAKSTSIICWCSNTPTALDFRYLLALLNSRLISAYFLTRFSGNRLQGNYLRIAPPQLRELPIAVPDLKQEQQQTLYQQVIAASELLHQLNRDLAISRFASSANQIQQQQIDDEIDTLIYTLYQVSEQEIDALNSAL